MNQRKILRYTILFISWLIISFIFTSIAQAINMNMWWDTLPFCSAGEDNFCSNFLFLLIGYAVVSVLVYGVLWTFRYFRSNRKQSVRAPQSITVEGNKGLQMVIRDATIDDAKTLAEMGILLHQLHIRKYPHIFKPATVDDKIIAFYENLLSQRHIRFWIAEDDGEPMGYTYVMIDHDPEDLLVKASRHIHIDQVFVYPKYELTGLADRFLEVVKNWASEEGMNRIVAHTWAFNKRALRAADKRGFKIISHRLELMLDDENESVQDV